MPATNPPYPPRKGTHKTSSGIGGANSSGFKTSRLGEAKNKGRYGGGKPPKKSGLCVQIAPFAAWPAIAMLVNAIAQSII